MKLKLIQTRIEELLTADEWLAARRVSAVVEDRGDVAAGIAAALERTDLCALVMTPKFAVESAASKTLVGSVRVVVEVIERPASNRERPGHATAQDAAEYIAYAINLATLPDDIGVLVCTLIDSRMLDDWTIAYLVEFKVKTHIANPILED